MKRSGQDPGEKVPAEECDVLVCTSFDPRQKILKERPAYWGLSREAGKKWLWGGQTCVLCLLKSVSDMRNESSHTTWRLHPQPDFHIFDGSYLYWESWGRQKIFCWCEEGSFKLYISIWGGAGNCSAYGGSKLTSWCYSCGPKVTADYACYSPAEEMPTVKNWGEEKSRLRTSCACFCTHVFHVGILLFFLLSPFCLQRETWKRAKEGQPYLYLCTCCFSYLYLCTCCFFAFQATVTELDEVFSRRCQRDSTGDDMRGHIVLRPFFLLGLLESRCSRASSSNICPAHKVWKSPAWGGKVAHARSEEYICKDNCGTKCSGPAWFGFINEELGQMEDQVKSKLESEAEKESGETGQMWRRTW